MSTSPAQAILAVLESDILTAAGTPILNFLSNVKTNPSPMNVAAQWVKLQGDLVAAVPGLEIALISQLITVIQNRITALQTQAATSAQTAAPTH